MIEKIVEKRKIIFLVALILVLVFGVLLLISNNGKDYSKVTLRKNKNTIFSVSDLIVDDVKYTDSEKIIKKKYGKATKEKKYKNDIFEYKKLYYDGITFILRENYDDFMLVGVEITKSKYKVSRGINVGDSVLKGIKKYKVDNQEGTYMYGNYSVKALSDSEIKNIIYLGVRGNKEVTYVYRDAVIDNTKTTVARLTYTYKNGKITKINWIYDYE